MIVVSEMLITFLIFLNEITFNSDIITCVLCDKLFVCIYDKNYKLIHFEFRWIKFEEDVEEGGNRWSKPHVATISLHSLFELRSCILNGTVMLDLDATNLDQISGKIHSC